jgi:ribonuclease J
MLNVIAHARNLGYIKCRDDLFQPLQNLRHYRDDQILILTTGSQGESMSALTRMSNSSHRQLEVRQGDTVIFSANPIPGNTIPVVRTIDRLMALGANVIYGKDKGIHVSGHGSQEEHKMMLALVRPKFFFPAHGELRMLRQHAKMAESMGIPSENIVIAENGDVVEVCQDYMRIVDKVPSGVELVDSSRDGMVKGDVLRDRQQISGEGIFTIAVSVGLDGKLSTNPDIQLSGVVLPMEHSQIIALVAKAIDNSLANSWGNYARNVGSLEIDWIGLRGQLERDLTRVLRQQIQSKPMIVFLLQTPPNSTQSAPAPAAKPNALGVTLKSGSNKVIPKVEQESSNGNGAAIEAPVATGAATASVGRRKRTAATV